MLESSELCGLLDALRRDYILSDDCEITTECNPAASGKAYFKELLSAGFNRLSIGVQCFDDALLGKLGRLHTSDEAKRTIYDAQDAGFENINIDLMSGLPDQGVAGWENDLRTAAGTGVRHISAYSLIIEEGTWFCDNKDSLALPSEDEERRMYDITEDVLGEYGLHRYEISNYAADGFECRHNCGYWTGVPYLGAGLGASSCYGDARYRNETDIENYIMLAERGSDVSYLNETLDTEAKISEFIMLGMRMTKGISLEKFKERFGRDLYSLKRDIINKYAEGGFVEISGGRLKFTGKGISVSNTILTDLI